ncbi:MAG: NAD-dependent epimerase/dehydratase family protein, partial [Acidobacteria bacterium]|nr:NAD-dependent epimerase/dehydratase family protein [Acidobacteriota bacterium]
VRAVVHEGTEALEGLEVERVQADVCQGSEVERAIGEGDFVFHLAGVISLAGGRRGRVHRVNVEGAEQVAAACRSRAARRLVHCSSVHAFDPSRGIGVMDESWPKIPTAGGRYTVYERSKAEGDRRVLAAVDEGLDAVLVHPTACIGPWDFAPSHMGRFFLDLANRRLPALVGGAYDWVDVRDVAAGMIAAADRGRKGHGYLLGGHFLPVEELAALACEHAGVPRPPRIPMALARLAALPLDLWARWTDAQPRFTTESLRVLTQGRPVDHGKAARALGFEPRPLAESIRDLYACFADRGQLGRESAA